MDRQTSVYPEDPRTQTCCDIMDSAETPGLFDAVTVGAWHLPHRIVMAPLTRARAGSERLPNALMAEYYGQRASAALIVSEATIVSPQAAGYALTPGIYNEAQVAGWKGVVEAVKSRGGHIVCQLWHCGRISHPSMQPDGALPVAPSAVQPGESAGQSFTEEGWQPFPVPRALETDEIAGLVEDFRHAAENAKAAGFDGVEIHGANGYLINQFLCDGTNKRTDAYGGSIENRCRFLMELLAAVESVWPSDRIGVRLSPWGTFLDCEDSDPTALYSHLCQALDGRGLAYLSVVEREWLGDAAPEKDASVPPSITAFVRQRYGGTILSAGGYSCKTACAMVQAGAAELVAFGTAFIANPDLPQRIRDHAELNEVDRSTFYGGGAKGYTDYPFMERKAAE